MFSDNRASNAKDKIFYARQSDQISTNSDSNLERNSFKDSNYMDPSSRGNTSPEDLEEDKFNSNPEIRNRNYRENSQSDSYNHNHSNRYIQGQVTEVQSSEDEDTISIKSKGKYTTVTHKETKNPFSSSTIWSIIGLVILASEPTVKEIAAKGLTVERGVDLVYVIAAAAVGLNGRFRVGDLHAIRKRRIPEVHERYYDSSYNNSYDNEYTRSSFNRDNSYINSRIEDNDNISSLPNRTEPYRR